MCSLDGRSQGLNPAAPLGKFSSHEGEWKKEEGIVSILVNKNTLVVVQGIMRKAL